MPKQSPLEQTRAGLATAEAALERRREELERLHADRLESLTTTAPIHSRQLRELREDIEHLTDVRDAWRDELKRQVAEDEDSRRRYDVRSGPNGWFFLVDRTTGQFDFKQRFSSPDEARRWIERYAA